MQRVTWGIRTSSLLAAGASLLLALPSPGQTGDFERDLAEIDEAIETNPNGVSQESLNSCKAMRTTAVLLRNQGLDVRAARRIKSCRRLLGLEGGDPQSATDRGLLWVA